MPRAHELGSKYGRGIVVAKNQQGGQMRAVVEMTANHGGHFQFNLCPSYAKSNEECFDTISSLEIAKSNQSRFDLTLKLPANISCENCVLQWAHIYHAVRYIYI